MTRTRAAIGAAAGVAVASVAFAGVGEGGGDVGGWGGGGVKHVLLIGVDGLSPEGIELAEAPVLWGLMREGSWTMRARAALPTSSSTNWASMVTGATPVQHGVTSNDWRRGARTIEPSAVGLEDVFPSIFGVLRETRPGAGIAAIYDWGDFGRLIERSALTVDVDAEGPEAAVEAAEAWFGREVSAGEPRLTFVHLDHVDGAGHRWGWSTPAYLEAVAKADALIGRMLSGLEERGMRGSTVVIVTSDHGGIGTGHGGETMEELCIPWIIAGPGIASGRRIEGPVHTEDTAATMAMLLGVELPAAAVGRPVRSAMAGYEGPLASRAALVARPKIGPARGLHVTQGGSVEVTFGAKGEGSTIRYTLDGSEVTERSMVYSGQLRVEGRVTVRARAFAAGGGVSEESRAEYRVLPEGWEGGVRYTAWRTPELQKLPDFAALEASGAAREEGVVPEITLFGGLGSKLWPFAARFEGDLMIAEAGEYGFGISSDDGCRLKIDGRVVVEDDGRHGARLRTGTIRLEPGARRIEVEYFNGGGAASLEVYYDGPGVERGVIPTTVLRPMERPAVKPAALGGDGGGGGGVQAGVGG